MGYKSKMLIKFLKKLKLKGIKINFIKIKGYKKNGHSYSWFLYKDHWIKEKKPMILLHTDIFFDPIYLDNILKSKKYTVDLVEQDSELCYFYKKKLFFEKIFQDDFFNVKIQNNTYDAIVAWQVIEHLNIPDLWAKKINNSLKLYISIISPFGGFPAAGRPIENFRPGRRRPAAAAAILSKSLINP